MTAPRRPRRGRTASRSAPARRMSRTEQRILLVLGALAAVLAVFLCVLLVLGTGSKKPSAVLIKLATPGRTPSVAAGFATDSPRPTVAPSLTPQPSTPPIRTVEPTQPPPPTVTQAPERSPSPRPTDTPSPTPSPTPQRTPSPTAVPARGLPALALLDFDLVPAVPAGPNAGALRITIGNLGAVDLVQQGIEIIVIDQTDTEVAHFTSAAVSIPAGGSVVITSAYKPARRTTLTVVINPNHTIAEADAPPGFDDPNDIKTKTVTPP